MLLPILAATALTTLLALLLAITARLNAILPTNRPPPRRRRGLSLSHSANGTTRSRRLDRATRDGHLENPYKHIMVILGSGGHTAEMLLMLRQVRLGRWERRSWVVSSGDSFSAGLASEFERGTGEGKGEWDIVELPRARRVHQSILTAPWTSLQCLWAAVKMLRQNPPDIIFTNGPGTGVIIILASFILRFFAIGESSRTRCVYVESLARCRRLSLSGKLVKPFVERFLVQWESLEGGRAEFRGVFALDAAGEVGLEGVGEVGEVDRRGWITYEL